MFGINNEDMELYKKNVEEFATQELAPMIAEESEFMVEAELDESGNPIPNEESFVETSLRVEIISIMTTLHASYTYADLKNKKMSSFEIFDYIYDRYTSYLMDILIQYGVSFDEEVLDEIVLSIADELPFLYRKSIKGYGNKNNKESFNKDLEKLKAYNNYLQDNFYGGDENSNK